MTEQEFWKCTPRKLQTMTRVHAEVNGASKKDDMKEGFIDQVL